MMGNADTPNARIQLAAQKNNLGGIARELANGAPPPAKMGVCPARINDAPHNRISLALTRRPLAVRAGADVDYIDPVFCWTALHIAALDGKSDAVDALLRASASPDIVNDGGNTAMHMAARNGQVRVRTHAIPPQRDFQGCCWMKDRGCFQCVELLCQAGGSLTIVNEAGQLARAEAAERVGRQFRFNGTSHQGVLDVIDRCGFQSQPPCLISSVFSC